MLCSLAPPQLRLMTYHHKMMCDCSIYNTSNYFQSSLNAWRRKRFKIMTDKSNNSRGREKDELTQAYKSYADYKFPNNETCHPRFRNAAYSVLFTPTNDECQFNNWKCVLRKCTACTFTAIPGVEIYLSNRALMLMFNKYTNQFNCLHNGILILKKNQHLFGFKGNI